MTFVALLGPQRLRPTLGAVVRSLGIEGRLATVTAGWQERESEDEELHAHLANRTVNLMLYARAEDVFARDPELAAAWRERQDRLRRMQELYRLQLAHAKEAARELLEREGDPQLLDPARRAAMAAIRLIDREHQAAIRAVQEKFEATWQVGGRPVVAEHRRRLKSLVARVDAVAVAGGHVAVLLGRLRLFGLDELVDGKPVIAWSAGAMAIAQRVVLFHDSPPQGAGEAEILDSGLGLAPAVVPLPHARRRLRLQDPVRVALLARRFAPAACVAMDEAAQMVWDGSGWRAKPGTRVLTPEGAAVEMEES